MGESDRSTRAAGDAEAGAFAPGVEGPPRAPDTALWFAFRGRELLVAADGSLAPGPEPRQLDIATREVHYLGRFGELHCYAAELAQEAEAPTGLAFRELRALFRSLDPELHRLAGRAVQIVDWDRTHRFCGACGAATRAVPGERARACPACGLRQYPRLAPAVIVSVERGDEILLGRSRHFPPGIYSVLAGFVEPGESVEEAVAREVREETGIELEGLRYFGSQPWPFPNSLMLGFQARYAGGELAIDETELEDARWFHRNDMPMLFPGSASIAQWLIHDFLRRG